MADCAGITSGITDEFGYSVGSVDLSSSNEEDYGQNAENQVSSHGSISQIRLLS